MIAKPITRRDLSKAAFDDSFAAPNDAIRGVADARWRRVLALVVEQGDGVIRWRSRIVWRWPMLRYVWTRYPKVATGTRPDAERRSAQTPSDWRNGEQSDNLTTRRT